MSLERTKKKQDNQYTQNLENLASGLLSVLESLVWKDQPIEWQRKARAIQTKFHEVIK